MEAPINVVIEFQGENLPNIMGEVKFMPATRLYKYYYTTTDHHNSVIDPIIRDTIQDTYQLEPGDMISQSVGLDSIDANRIKYSLFTYRPGPRPILTPVVRPRKHRGGKRVRKNKRKTRRTKRLHGMKS